MDVQKLLRNPRFRLEQGGAAEPESVKQFQEAAPPNLPRTYLRFMQACNGARGKIPYETGYIDLWPLERALEKNREHGVPRSLPGFFAFGSDGADELFLFDLRKVDGAAVCSVSTKSPTAAAVAPITKSFSEFLEGVVIRAGV